MTARRPISKRRRRVVHSWNRRSDPEPFDKLGDFTTTPHVIWLSLLAVAIGAFRPQRARGQAAESPSRPGGGQSRRATPRGAVSDGGYRVYSPPGSRASESPQGGRYDLAQRPAESPAAPSRRGTTSRAGPAYSPARKETRPREGRDIMPDQLSGERERDGRAWPTTAGGRVAAAPGRAPDTPHSP
jgi:hypothetical protein